MRIEVAVSCSGDIETIREQVENLSVECFVVPQSEELSTTAASLGQVARQRAMTLPARVPDIVRVAYAKAFYILSPSENAPAQKPMQLYGSMATVTSLDGLEHGTMVFARAVAAVIPYAGHARLFSAEAWGTAERDGFFSNVRTSKPSPKQPELVYWARALQRAFEALRMAPTVA